MPKKRKPEDFSYMDDLLDEVIVYIVRAFNSYKKRIMKFDEVNAFELTKSLYETIEAKAEKLYQEAAWWYYEGCGGRKFPKRRYGKGWLLEFLDAFDPVTGYIYFPELERKMHRQYEEVVSQLYADPNRGKRGGKVTSQTQTDIRKRVNRSEYLLTLQITQKAIAAVDQAVLDAYRERGITKVMWHTQRDERVCDECRPRDKMIFDIDNLPKRHYKCRCWLQGVTDEDQR